MTRLSADELKEKVTEGLARHAVPGASVAILRGGEILSVAAGIANLDTGVAVTPDTVMHIGSITKVINAALVMQLVDEGKVELEARVMRYLPDLRLKDQQAAAQISVRMLLNHTCGIDGEMLPDFGHDEETIAKGVLRFADAGQVHRPGTEFSYCNAGSVIAGYLVERVRQSGWYQIVRERIYEPLKMKHAATLPEEALLFRASVGHFKTAAGVVPTRCAFLPLSFAPAGTTLMMSAGDLVRFAQALITDGAILSAQSAKAMRAMTVDNRARAYTYSDSIGLGWMMSDDGGLFHTGGGPGVLTMLFAVPARQAALAVLTNAAHGFGFINEILEPWLDGMGLRNPFSRWCEAPDGSVADDLSRYAGVYENVSERYSVRQDEGSLFISQQARFVRYGHVTTEPTPPARLIPLREDTFLLDTGAEIPTTPAALRVFTFLQPDDRGQMRYLGNSHKLFKRNEEHSGHQ